MVMFSSPSNENVILIDEYLKGLRELTDNYTGIRQGKIPMIIRLPECAYCCSHSPCCGCCWFSSKTQREFEINLASQIGNYSISLSSILDNFRQTGRYSLVEQRICHFIQSPIFQVCIGDTVGTIRVDFKEIESAAKRFIRLSEAFEPAIKIGRYLNLSVISIHSITTRKKNRTNFCMKTLERTEILSLMIGPGGSRISAYGNILFPDRVGQELLAGTDYVQSEDNNNGSQRIENIEPSLVEVRSSMREVSVMEHTPLLAINTVTQTNPPVLTSTAEETRQGFTFPQTLEEQLRRRRDAIFGSVNTLGEPHNNRQVRDDVIANPPSINPLTQDDTGTRRWLASQNS